MVGSSEKRTYAWSADGSLTETKHYDAAGSLELKIDYAYDAFGEMIQKSDGTVTSRYAQDGWYSNMAAPIPRDGVLLQRPGGSYR